MYSFHQDKRRTLVLVILDGFGINPSKLNNAVAQARTPRLDEYFHRYPWTLLDAAVATDSPLLLTADHGNCELLQDPVTDAPHTQHTTFPVPFLLVARQRYRLAGHGGLANVAPTVLDLLGLAVPQAMSHGSLLRGHCPSPQGITAAGTPPDGDQG